MEWSKKEEVPVRSKLKKSPLFILKIAHSGVAENLNSEIKHSSEKVGTNPLATSILMFSRNNMATEKGQHLHQTIFCGKGSLGRIMRREHKGPAILQEINKPEDMRGVLHTDMRIMQRGHCLQIESRHHF
ncbi:MAG: hypothetical protein M1395_09050 [Bacteroidetes bacterium]|jgi:hypothetical protein|nr:hypothetical protein [Bacteroidota bacterium]